MMTAIEHSSDHKLRYRAASRAAYKKFHPLILGREFYV
jgi:hypothetical protein